MAVFATFVASLAHTIGGGAPPGPVALAVALAFSAPLAMALSGARARMLRTAVSALVALYVAYPHRGEQMPVVPWLGDALGRAVDSAPVLADDERDLQRLG